MTEIQSPQAGGHMGPGILKAILAVMAEVGVVGKDGWNQQQKFNFRGIDTVLDRVGPLFHKHGVIPIPIIEQHAYRDVEVGTKRTQMREATVQVRYRFCAVDGSYIDAVVPGEALDSGDKGTTKAMSVAFRTAMIQTLAIPTGEQDADATSYERSTAAPPPRPEPVTDRKWLDDITRRIQMCPDKQRGRELLQELQQHTAAHEVNTADARTLHELMRQRATELDEAEGGAA